MPARLIAMRGVSYPRASPRIISTPKAEARMYSAIVDFLRNRKRLEIIISKKLVICKNGAILLDAVDFSSFGCYLLCNSLRIRD